MRQRNFGFKDAALLRHGLDVVLPFREAREEVCGIQLVEAGLGAFKRELRQPLGAKTPSSEDVEQLEAVRPFEVEACPGASIDLGVNPEVPVSIVELEEQRRNRELVVRLGGRLGR